jgi:hypothetical protein
MTQLRRVLTSLAVGVLLCQIATAAATGVVMHAQRAGAGADLVCHCQHGEGHECPMHKTTSGKARCSMRAVDDIGALAGVSMLLGPQGLVPRVAETGCSQDVASSCLTVDFDVFGRVTPPTLPPPRA